MKTEIENVTDVKKVIHFESCDHDIGKPELYKPIDDDPIFSLIIKFLTEFAHNARYYNLDSLTGHPNSTDEPLRAWNKNINKIIVERHYRHNKKKEEAIS